MKKLAVLLLFPVLFASFCPAQTDSSVHVKAFPGNDVGTKVTNAMATCPTTVPCILIIDASLASMNPGTLPSLCGNCYLQDWRNGPPTSSYPLPTGAASGMIGSTGYYSPNQPQNVMAFGADRTGVKDSSAAILAAAQAACYNGSHGTGLYFPAGIYSVHEVDLSSYAGCVELIGDFKGSAVIQYDGAGAAGSYLFKFGSLSAGGWTGIEFNAGLLSGTPTAVAQNILLITGALDDTTVCRDSQFTSSWGDAIVASGGLTNFHCDNVRFDGIGGYAFTIVGTSTQESRPLTLTRWTLDNTISSNASALMTSLGYYDGTHWGKGLFYLNVCTGVSLTIGPGRFESNKQLIEENAPYHDEATLVYEDNTTTGSCHIVVNQAGGFGTSTMPLPLFSLSKGNTAHIVVSFSDNYNHQSIVKERDNQTYYGRGSDSNGIYVYDGPSTTQNGWSIDGQKQDVSASVTGRYDYWPLGGIAWYPPSNISPGQKGLGQYAITPNLAQCFTQPGGGTITSAAVVTAGSASVTNMGSSATYLPGDCIAIAGAGASGATLETYITGVDYDTETLTMAANASTSVSPATITWDKPIWRDMSPHMSAAPTTGQWYKGEIVWSSNPSSGNNIGWVCTASGTPGTWVPFGLVSSSTVPTTSGTTTTGAGVCWKSANVLGTCTAGTWPSCSTCN